LLYGIPETDADEMRFWR